MGGENEVGILRLLMSRFRKDCDHDWWTEGFMRIDDLDIAIDECSKCGANLWRPI